jgi:hypothetical protein
MLAACWQGPPAAKVTRVMAEAAAMPAKPGFHALASL